MQPKQNIEPAMSVTTQIRHATHYALLTKREVKIYHLLTESEVITGKSQTEALMY